MRLILIFAGLAAMMSYFTYTIADNKFYKASYNYDKKMCIALYKNACVDQVCLNSNEKECKDQCKKGAVYKCKEQGYD